jgi:hypothetical protein
MHDERGESTTINLNASMKASVEATGSLQVSTASPNRKPSKASSTTIKTTKPSTKQHKETNMAHNQPKAKAKSSQCRAVALSFAVLLGVWGHHAHTYES